MKSRSKPRAKYQNNKRLSAKKVIVFLIVLAIASTAVYYGARLIDNFLADKQSNSSFDSAVVGINNGAFDPETLTVQNGQAVTWTNTTDQPLSLGFAKKSGEDIKSLENTDGSIKPSETFSYTFGSSGTYTVTANSEDNQFSSTIIVNE